MNSLLLMSFLSSASLDCVDHLPTFADTLVQATGASGTGYGDPLRALNGVNGGGLNAGSLDVFSLNMAKDGILIASFSQGAVCNGEGPDLAVFENSFRQVPSNALFFEPVVVSVSWDGVNYEDFPHAYSGTTSLAAIVDEKNWTGFAGMSPVLYNETSWNFANNGIDPLDSVAAGGDSFDLDQLPDTETGLTIKTYGVRFVKLTGAPKLGFPTSPSSFGGLADIDGIYAKRFRSAVQ